MLKRARLGKHGGHPTILSRWYDDEKYRKSLSDIGWREHHHIMYDRIALETHIYKATIAERIQIMDSYSKFRRRNSATTQSTTRLCSSEKRMRLHDKHLARTQQEYRDIRRSQQIRQRKGQQFEGHEDLDYVVDQNTSWRFYRQSRGNLQTSASGSRANLQAASSSSSTGTKPSGRQANEILSTLQVLTSGDFSHS